MTATRKQLELSPSSEFTPSGPPPGSDPGTKPARASGPASSVDRTGSAAWLDHCAHDLRGILGAADGYVQLLELRVFGPIPDRQLKEITRIRALLGKAFGIVDEIEREARRPSLR
jgi:hypothetical protein